MNYSFNNDLLECVSTYKYLGLVWSRNGNLTCMEQDRVEKAWKASYAIQKAISTRQNVSVELAMSLLDKQLEPILLYGCPIWGFHSNNCSIRLKYDSIDTKQLKKQLYTILKSIEMTDVEILYCRYVKTSKDVTITLKNVMDKIKVLSHKGTYPTTYKFTENAKHAYTN